MARVRLEDVARHAGVSMKTVSNVVHDFPHVSAKMRERVQTSIDLLGYRPNAMGRGLATGRTGLIALALADVTIPYFAELARMISTHCHQARLPAAARADRQLDRGGARDRLGERGGPRRRRHLPAGGDVLARDREAPHRRAHRAAGRRTRAAGPRSRDDRQRRGGDDRHAAPRVAGTAAHRLPRPRAGPAHRDLEDPDHGLPARPRARGPARSIPRCSSRAPRSPPRPRRPRSAPRSTAACGSTRSCAGTTSPPSAPSAPSRSAASTCRARWRVTGWDDIAMASFTHPTLTTIAADTTALADTALDLLEERISGFEGLGRHVIVPHRFVIRESAPEGA